MKYERSNENTIKVWITSGDLKKREVNILDLMNDKNKVENFFYSILEEVDDNHDFQNNDLVSFQILPESDGFQMIISKDNNVVSKLAEKNVKFMSEQTKERFDVLNSMFNMNFVIPKSSQYATVIGAALMNDKKK